MVRAILEGRKTQTRRVVKPLGNDDGFVILDYGNGGWPYRSDDGDSSTHIVRRGGKLYIEETPHACPYGQPGDRLWVRETWADVRTPASQIQTVYRADWPYKNPSTKPWKPSIHMPRWASRILLEVTGVRIERLQDISEEDAIAEGVSDILNPVGAYRELWDSINGDGAWVANPWVWIVEFKRLEA